MLVVTHEMGFAREVGDRVVLMSDGRIVEDNLPEKFFEAPDNEDPAEADDGQAGLSDFM